MTVATVVEAVKNCLLWVLFKKELLYFYQRIDTCSCRKEKKRKTSTITLSSNSFCQFKHPKQKLTRTSVDM
jgi:hypothetical protein